MARSARNSVLRWAGLVVLIVVAASCRRHNSGPVSTSATSPSRVNLRRPVGTAVAEQRSLVYAVETIGVIEAEGMTDIAAGMKGVVDEVTFREGDEVDPKQTNPLILIDQRSYTIAQRLAEANLQRASAASTLARDRYERFTRAGVASSPQEIDEARLALGVAEAEVEAARANVDIARHNLDRSRVRPPYRGRINKRLVTPGMYVEDKTIIATMADLSRVRLVAYVPESAAAQVRELMALQEQRRRAAAFTLSVGGWFAGPISGLLGTDVVRRGDVPSGFDPDFTVLSFPDRPFRARIFYLSTVADPSTHMFECKAEVESQPDWDLKPGYTAKVRLPLRNNPTACVVPEESIRATERGNVVFEPVRQPAEDGSTSWIARARTVDLGYRTPGYVEIRAGLSPGTLVVRRGAESLEDGMPITLMTP